MMPAHTMSLSLPTDREIMFTRDFDAPRRLVWDAHTKPELLRRWLGVNERWSLDVCEIDLRVGGTYRYVWRLRDGGMEMGMGGTYREIVLHERMVTDEKFDHAWYEGSCIGTWTLSDTNGKGDKTTLTLRLLYDSKAVRDAVLQSPMKEGMTAGYIVLETLLATQ